MTDTSVDTGNPIQDAMAEGEAAVLADIQASTSLPASPPQQADSSREEVIQDASVDAQAIVERETPRTDESESPPADESTRPGWWKTSVDGLDPAATFTFKQDGEEVTLPVEKVLKAAARAPFLARQETKLRAERNDALTRAQEADQYKEAAEAGDRILTEILRGDNDLLSRMRAKFQETTGARRANANQPAPAPDQALDPAMQEGQRVVQEVLTPYAAELANVFPESDANEIVSEILTMIGEEPDMDFDTLEDVLERRIVDRLEEAGYEIAGELPRLQKTWREQKQAGERTPTRAGIKPRGSARTHATPREAAQAKRIAELQAQLQEGATRDQPDVGGARTPGGVRQLKGGERADERAKSSLLDLSGAESMQDIQRELDKLTSNY